MFAVVGKCVVGDDVHIATVEVFLATDRSIPADLSQLAIYQLSVKRLRVTEVVRQELVYLFDATFFVGFSPEAS